MPNDAVTREIFGNIDPVSKWVFYALAAASIGSFVLGVRRRSRLWRLGRADGHAASQGRGHAATAPGRSHWLTVVIDIFIQQRLHKRRRPAGRAHRLLFWGFVILLIGTTLVAIEHYSSAALGRAPTAPLFHKGLYFAIFESVLDAAGLALIVGSTWFLVRRLRGDSSIGHRGLDWAVLGSLLLLCVTGYLTEGLRIIREQTPQPGYSFVGLAVARVSLWAGFNPTAADATHFVLWWVHSVVALGLIAAFPYTRLLHSVAGVMTLATPKTPHGTMAPVKIEDVELTGLVGAATIRDFTRRQLRELDACVSCGRCQDACPAFTAGKPLSPRDLVQDLRTSMVSAESASTASSVHDTIAAETAWSCTSCHACVDVCPLGVDPLRFIFDIRRNLVAEGQLRGSPATALQKTQRSGNPWGLPQEERLNWAEGLDVPLASDGSHFDVLYWVGCAAAYDRRIQRVARAMVTLLQASDVNFAVLGPEERCTGESARRMGEEFLFQEMAATNLETLSRHSVKKIVTHCPHCLNTFKNDYPQFGDTIEVVHHTEFLAGLAAEGKLPTVSTDSMAPAQLAYHDPCYLARVNNVTEAPRTLVQLTLPTAGPGKMIEMPRCGHDTSCCGAGGGRMWFDDAPEQRAGGDRVDEFLETGADQLVVSCPFCLTMMSDGLAARGSDIVPLDISERLIQTLATDA